MLILYCSEICATIFLKSKEPYEVIMLSKKAQFFSNTTGFLAWRNKTPPNHIFHTLFYLNSSAMEFFSAEFLSRRQATLKILEGIVNLIHKAQNRFRRGKLFFLFLDNVFRFGLKLLWSQIWRFSPSPLPYHTPSVYCRVFAIFYIV